MSKSPARVVHRVPPGSVRGELLVKVWRGRKIGRFLIDTDNVHFVGPWSAIEAGVPDFWTLDALARRRLMHLVGFAHHAPEGEEPGALFFDWCPDHAPIRHKGGYVSSYGISLQGVPVGMLAAAVALCESIVRESYPWQETLPESERSSESCHG